MRRSVFITCLLWLAFLAGCLPRLPDKGGDSGGSIDPCEDGVPIGTIDPDVDNDGDGYTYSGGDCNDCDASTSPNSVEFCDGIDSDCNGAIDDGAVNMTTWYADADGDGIGTESYTQQACDQPMGYVASSGDCDDGNSAISPLMLESCDGIDNDCDNMTDEADAYDAAIWYADADGDGFGGESAWIRACTQPLGSVSQDSDCNDGDAAVNPGAVEVCDEIDNDCDGLTDDEDVGAPTGNVDPATYSTWYVDSDSDGFGDEHIWQQACAAPFGFVANQTDCDDADTSINPGEAEVCADGVDNDCDPDNDLTGSTWHADIDSDGYGDPDSSTVDCTQPSDTVLDSTDCDDTDGLIHPGAYEYCDSVDNDCDSMIDEADAIDASTWYADDDSDGYGNADSTLTSCAQPSGFVANAADCDDTNDLVHPGAYEYCTTAYDDDCDGSINESSAVDAGVWYVDNDSDGYGDPSVSATACTAPTDYVAQAGDCDDTNASISGGTSEICDGLDNNCDGHVDEEATDASVWYVDNDSDGYGDAADSLAACDQPSGYIDNDEDCDDSDPSVNPEGIEIDFVLDSSSSDFLVEVNNCSDGMDNDCNGESDSSDWACSDEDADGISNGADPYIGGYDIDLDGIQEVCGLAKNLLELDWTMGDVFVQVNGAWTTLTATVTLTSITVSGIAVDAWCYEPAVSGVGYAGYVSTVGMDGSSAVDTGNCSDWVRPIEDVCAVYGDHYCEPYYSSDGCSAVGNRAFNWSLSTSGVISPN